MRTGWARLNVESRFLAACGFPLRSLLRFGCVVLLGAGVFLSWWASTRQGGDFIYPYMLSYSLLHGEPIYDRQWQFDNIPAITGQSVPGEGFFYPAGTGFSTLPLALLSFRNAQILWLSYYWRVVLVWVAAHVGPTLRDGHMDGNRRSGLAQRSICWGNYTTQRSAVVMGCLRVCGVYRRR